MLDMILTIEGGVLKQEVTYFGDGSSYGEILPMLMPNIDVY